MDTEIKTSEAWTLGDVALDLLLGPLSFTDFLLETDKPAMIRRSAGDWVEVLDGNGDPLIADQARIMAFLDGVFNGDKWVAKLNEKGSLHPAVNLAKENAAGKIVECRVRVTVQKQLMGEAIGLVLRPLRVIPQDLPSLGLPIQTSVMLKAATSGLIVVTGPTGSGKSTTLAAMVNEINVTKRANILTIEDPVEFVHERVKSIINQRELGIDVASYEEGVKDALRFVPDVILIGEIRDAATMHAALRAAESGHLVLTTTHAPNATAAIRKMISYLDSSQADTQALAASLVGIIAQALVRDATVPGKNFLAYETLNCRAPKVLDVITAGASDGSGQKMTQLENSIRTGQLDSTAVPMIASLRDLVKQGKVDRRVAAAVVVHPDDKAELLQMTVDSKPPAAASVDPVSNASFSSSSTAQGAPVKSTGWSLPRIGRRDS